MRSASSKNDSPALSSVMSRAEGVRATSSTFADCVASAADYGRLGAPPGEVRADAGGGAQQFRSPVMHCCIAALPPQQQPRLAAATCHGDVVLVERGLLGVGDRRALLHETQGEKRLEEAQLVL